MHPQRLPGNLSAESWIFETLKQTNQELIATLDDVMNIQKRGPRQREPRQKLEMRKMEEDLKNKIVGNPALKLQRKQALEPV